MAMALTILALTGCGDNAKTERGSKLSAPAQAATTQSIDAAQWDVLVDTDIPLAVSDLTGWLIEHGVMSNVVLLDGKRQVRVGPFDSQAQATAKKTELVEKLTKAKKRNIFPVVVEHRPVQ